MPLMSIEWNIYGSAMSSRVRLALLAAALVVLVVTGLMTE